jgi:hypothetical protein
VPRDLVAWRAEAGQLADLAGRRTLTGVGRRLGRRLPSAVVTPRNRAQVATKQSRDFGTRPAQCTTRGQTKELPMKRIATLTTLVMSIATAAYAQPRVYDRDRVRDRGHEVVITHDRYEHYGQSRWARDFHGRWVPFAPYGSVRGERQFVPGVNNRFRMVRIEGLRGEPTILKVTVEFDNGTAQMVDMNTSLPSGTGEVLDLTGNVRSVKRVIVYDDPRSRGLYTVYGA